MRRRDFLGIVGGAAASAPLAARAQQPERERRIGVLQGGTADDPNLQAAFAAFVQFVQELQQLGWIDGRNVRIDHRHGAGDVDIMRKHTAELVAFAPDVIVTAGSVALVQLLQATHNVPIVFVYVPDPVGSGFVKSLSRPGGNATGFMQFEYSLAAKWLELLKEIAPGVTRV